MQGFITSKETLTPEQISEIQAAWYEGHVGIRKRSWWRKFKERRWTQKQYRLYLKKSPKVNWKKLYYDCGGK